MRHWRFELFGNVDVAEIVLAIQIVDGQPFDFGQLLVVGQTKGEILVEVAFENVCSILNIHAYWNYRGIRK